MGRETLTAYPVGTFRRLERDKNPARKLGHKYARNGADQYVTTVYQQFLCPTGSTQRVEYYWKYRLRKPHS